MFWVSTYIYNPKKNEMKELFELKEIKIVKGTNSNLIINYINLFLFIAGVPVVTTIFGSRSD